MMNYDENKTNARIAFLVDQLMRLQEELDGARILCDMYRHDASDTKNELEIVKKRLDRLNIMPEVID